MAQIAHFGPLRHLRAEANQYILHYRKGRLVREGRGLAYWYLGLHAAVARLPVEDVETTFVLKERSADFQEVTVQFTLVYRIAEPARAAARLNFTISQGTGAWLEAPLERLAGFWSQRVQPSARDYLRSEPVVTAVREGADAIRSAVDTALRGSQELPALGLELVGVQVTRVAPTAELEKALQTPTREALQQKADEATFARRALAVEKERAIKENELQSQIELARRQEELIKNENANELLRISGQAAAERARVEAEAERSRILATAAAEAQRLQDQARFEGESRRVEVWSDAPGRVVVGLALQELAGKLQNIQHLSVSPALLGDGLKQLLQEAAEK